MSAIIGELAQALTAIAALLTVIFSLRNGSKIHQVYISLNSRLSQLLKTTAEAAHKSGHKEGVDEERARAVAEKNGN